MKPNALLGWEAGATAGKEKPAAVLLVAVLAGCAPKLKAAPAVGAEPDWELPKPVAPAVLVALAVGAELPKEKAAAVLPKLS